MVDIDKIKLEIIERLKPLEPNKIILFGSYAYGTPTPDSDIDLFLVKEINAENARAYRVEARKKLRDLVKKYNVGFDIMNASETFLNQRDDYFYKIDILEKGKVLYAQ